MKNLLLVLCLVAFCLQAEAALPATDQNLEAAIAYGKSYQGEKNDAVMLQPWVIAESFETNPYRDEERIIVFVIPFASLKAQTSYEKCCAPPLFDL